MIFFLVFDCSFLLLVPSRWESGSQALRLHLLQLKGLNRSIVRDGHKV